jgi:HTH-type transcriptional regulator/antitoxin HigA
MTQTNYAVAPGEYLKEWLEEHHQPLEDLSSLLVCTPRQATKLLTGYTRITPTLATRLELLTTIPADTWLRYETKYRSDLERLNPEHEGNQ